MGLNRVKANAQLQLAVAESPVSVKSELQNGNLTAIAKVGTLPLNALVPQIPVPAQVDQGKVSLIANVTDLLKPQPDLSRIEAIAAVNLTVAGGNVTTVTQLEKLGWQSRVTAQNVNLNPLLSQGSPNTVFTLDPVNANASLRGDLNQLFTPQGKLGNLPVIVQQSQISSGDQRVTAQGKLVLANLAQRPQLSTVNLNVNSQINLAELPVNQVIAQLPIAPEFKPAFLDLIGQTQFRGQLIGQNVTDLRGLKLAGQVAVNNLSLNEYDFEHQLTGPLSAQYGQPISLDLNGEQDQLAFNIKPCRGKCLSPYLPTSFSLRQAYNRPEAILAQGQLNGDRLKINVEQFPLAILNVRPALRYNVP